MIPFASANCSAFPEETQVEILSLAELQAPIVCQGLAYWDKLRAGRRYPARDEIRVRDIAALLKHMVVAKGIDGGEDFLLSIVGDEVGRCYRAPIMHRRLSEIAVDLPKTAARWLPIYRQTLQSGLPVAVLVKVGLEAPEINFSHAETVCLPFGPEGGPADFIATFGQHTARSGLPRFS
jgi:hypothetical protein